MTLRSSNTPLYSHPLPEIETWLRSHGCQQDSNDLHCWHLERPEWKAELWLDIEELRVRYFQRSDGGQDIMRSFPYSLSRQDLENAVFCDP